jgi:hypothetical protein
MKLILKILCICIVLAGAMRVKTASAESITIAPVFQELVVTQSTKSETGSFSITNRSNLPQTYKLRAINIDTSDQTGGILLSGLNQDFVKRHGLVAWLEFQETEVTILSNQTREVAFQINNSADLPPGGHYGAILTQLVTQTPTPDDNKVSLNPEAAALIFVKKIGGERYDLNVKSTTIEGVALSLPKSIGVLLENRGDIHVIPRGSVVVKDMFGREIKRGAINTESVLILPAKNRLIDVDLRSLRGGLRWPGRYTATISYRFEGQIASQVTNIRFWVLNLPVLGGVIFTITGLFWLIFRYGYGAGALLSRIWKYQHKHWKLASRTRKVINRFFKFFSKK